MPTTRAILDSSPVAIPPARPLKRSASTASLPTPPRTHHKRSNASRSRSRGSAVDTDSERDSDRCDGGKVVLGRKKRRTSVILSGHDEEEDSENEFWIGRGGKISQDQERKSVTRSPSPAPVQFRAKAPVSPPPSRRQTIASGPPVTPPRASSSRGRDKKGKAGPMRDSPNNPFLEDSPSSPPAPRTPTQHGEKPMLTYVFRGMKASFHNPFYNLPPEAHEHSLLPVDHPDFSPSEQCPPKLLFPSARHRSRHRSESPVDSDDEPAPTIATPKKLNFAQEVELAENRNRADPVRQAIGPVRATRR